MRKIAVITGTRAEYGLLYRIMKGILENSMMKLELIVTGMHLSPEFGLTVREIEKDGFPIADRVEMLLSSDTEVSIATSTGLGMIGFAKAYERMQPDIILVLGDRFEIFSAVAAAVPFRIPVAHIHGGESTEGLIDEPIRHSITKMSHIHFTTTEKYKDRVILMGENPEHVFCFGAPGLDNIYNLELMDEEDIRKELEVPDGTNMGLVTYHPVTLEHNTAESQMTELLSALQDFDDMYWIFTMPNADTNGRVIIEKINHFFNGGSGRGKSFASLGQKRYLSTLKHASIMAGNSSSGIIEASSFGLPVINIGDRQAGRIRGGNVIDVECKKSGISDAIKKGLSYEFTNMLKGLKNPYGEGHTSEKIVNILKTISLGETLIKKKYYEVVH